MLVWDSVQWGGVLYSKQYSQCGLPSSKQRDSCLVCDHQYRCTTCSKHPLSLASTHSLRSAGKISWHVSVVANVLFRLMNFRRFYVSSPDEPNSHIFGEHLLLWIFTVISLSWCNASWAQTFPSWEAPSPRTGKCTPYQSLTDSRDIWRRWSVSSCLNCPFPT